jgi:hypothetical protein
MASEALSSAAGKRRAPWAAGPRQMHRQAEPLGEELPGILGEGSRAAGRWWVKWGACASPSGGGAGARIAGSTLCKHWHRGSWCKDCRGLGHLCAKGGGGKEQGLWGLEHLRAPTLSEPVQGSGELAPLSHGTIHFRCQVATQNGCESGRSDHKEGKRVHFKKQKVFQAAVLHPSRLLLPVS